MSYFLLFTEELIMTNFICDIQSYTDNFIIKKEIGFYNFVSSNFLLSFNTYSSFNNHEFLGIEVET